MPRALGEDNQFGKHSCGWCTRAPYCIKLSLTLQYICLFFWTVIRTLTRMYGIFRDEPSRRYQAPPGLIAFDVAESLQAAALKAELDLELTLNGIDDSSIYGSVPGRPVYSLGSDSSASTQVGGSNRARLQHMADIRAHEADNLSAIQPADDIEAQSFIEGWSGGANEMPATPDRTEMRRDLLGAPRKSKPPTAVAHAGVLPARVKSAFHVKHQQVPAGSPQPEQTQFEPIVEAVEVRRHLRFTPSPRQPHGTSAPTSSHAGDARPGDSDSGSTGHRSSAAPQQSRLLADLTAPEEQPTMHEGGGNTAVSEYSGPLSHVPLSFGGASAALSLARALAASDDHGEGATDSSDVGIAAHAPSLLSSLLPVAPGADVNRLNSTISALTIAYRQLELVGVHRSSQLSSAQADAQDWEERCADLDAQLSAARETNGYLRHCYEQMLVQLAGGAPMSRDLRAASHHMSAASGAASASGSPAGGEASAAAASSHHLEQAMLTLPSLHLLRGEALHIAAERMNNLEHDVVRKDRTIASLQAQVRDARAWQGAGLAGMRQECARLNDEISRSASLHFARVRDLELKLKEAAKLAADAEKSRSSAVSAMTGLQSQIQALKSELSTSSSAFARTKQTLAENEQKLNWAEEAITVLKSEVAGRDALLSDQSSTISQLHIELEAARSGGASLRGLAPVTNSLRLTNNSQHDDSGVDANATSSTATQNSASSASPASARELAELRSEVASLRHALATARSDASRVQNDAAAARAALLEHIQRNQQSTQTFKVDGGSQTGADASVEQMSATIDEQSMELALLRAQLQAAQQHQLMQAQEGRDAVQQRLEQKHVHTPVPLNNSSTASASQGPCADLDNTVAQMSPASPIPSSNDYAVQRRNKHEIVQLQHQSITALRTVAPPAANHAAASEYALDVGTPTTVLHTQPLRGAESPARPSWSAPSAYSSGSAASPQLQQQQQQQRRHRPMGPVRLGSNAINAMDIEPMLPIPTSVAVPSVAVQRSTVGTLTSLSDASGPSTQRQTPSSSAASAAPRQPMRFSDIDGLESVAALTGHHHPPAAKHQQHQQQHRHNDLAAGSQAPVAGRRQQQQIPYPSQASHTGDNGADEGGADSWDEYDSEASDWDREWDEDGQLVSKSKQRPRVMAASKARPSRQQQQQQQRSQQQNQPRQRAHPTAMSTAGSYAPGRASPSPSPSPAPPSAGQQAAIDRSASASPSNASAGRASPSLADQRATLLHKVQSQSLTMAAKAAGSDGRDTPSNGSSTTFNVFSADDRIVEDANDDAEGWTYLRTASGSA